MQKNLTSIYKHITWKISYEIGDGIYPPEMFWEKTISQDVIADSWKKYCISHGDMGIYIHIPFCSAQCTFCNCSPTITRNIIEYDKYLDYLEKEMKEYSSLITGGIIRTVYIGGGSPSILTEIQLKRLLLLLQRYFDLSSVKQFTMTVNPDSTTEEKFRIFKEYGVDRIKLGVQTFDVNVLRAHGRVQTLLQVENAVALAKKYQIGISLDIMVGLIGQTMESLITTLETVRILNVEHVSINPFWPSKNTIYAKKGKIYNEENILQRNAMLCYAETFKSKYYSDLNNNIHIEYERNSKYSILGLGHGAYSKVFGEVQYGKNIAQDYYNSLEGDNGIYFSGIQLSLRDEVITYLIHNLRYGCSMSFLTQILGSPIELSSIYKRIQYLMGQQIIIKKLVDHNEYIFFHPSIVNSDTKIAICQKLLYDKNLIEKFIRYVSNHPDEFVNGDLRLKQFYLS